MSDEERNELIRLRAANGHMQQEINILRQREIDAGNLDEFFELVRANAELKNHLKDAKEYFARILRTDDLAYVVALAVAGKRVCLEHTEFDGEGGQGVKS